MEEIPAELLNQIYSEDLDSAEIERIQQNEWKGPDSHEYKPRKEAERRPQQLIGGDDDVDMEDVSPPQYRPVPKRRASPPPMNMNPPGMNSHELEENENEMLQRVIQESLNDYPRCKIYLFFTLIEYIN